MILEVIKAMDIKVIKVHLLTYFYWIVNVWGKFWEFLKDPESQIVLQNISLLVGIVLTITAVGYTIHKTIYVKRKTKQNN